MKKSINLIELIIVIVVLGIAVAPLLITLADLTYRGTQGELLYQAVIVGRDKLEDLLSMNFDDINLCYDASTCIYSDSIKGYRRDVTVRYVDPDASPPSCDGDICPLDKYVPKDHVTNYKRIDVAVSHNLIDTTLYFSTVVCSTHEPD